MKKQKYYLLKEEKSTKSFYYTVLGIAVFIFIFFPFFAVNLRYQTGYIFSKILDYIGSVCLTFGGLIAGLCIAALFVGRTIKVGWFIVGLILLWVGCWCTGSVIHIFGFPLGDEKGTPGYH
ncbi:MAG: hypothetical protein ACFFCI_09410 [Promethearchaeota archaeon]